MQRQERTSKYWCWTLNNPTVEDEETLQGLRDERRITYLVYGREVGESGTPHLQGYLETPRHIPFSRARRILGGRAHLEVRRGTAREAIQYCQKDGDFYQFGVPTLAENQGQRTDLDDIKHQIDDGTPEIEIAQRYFSRWLIHRRGFREYRNLTNGVGLRLDVQVCLLWGKSGTGKTRYCYERDPDLFRCPDPDTLQWWDGYQGEETILIDDYRGKGPESFVLALLDVYPLQLPIKGGFVPLRAKTIFITTNLQPSQLHNWENEASREAFKRRVHKCIKFSEPSWGPHGISEFVDAAPFTWE